MALTGTQSHNLFGKSPLNPMMTTQPKDITKNGGDGDAVQTSEQDFAIGSQEELTGLQSLRSYTWRSFFRSVLLQMILFGLWVSL
jgi:hypothetical protein